MKTTKPHHHARYHARTACALLNGIIHARNLYRGHSRFIDAVVTPDCRVEVTNLQTGEQVEFTIDGSFRDGRGQSILGDSEPGIYEALTRRDAILNAWVE
jgi:hypothetical protein